MAGHGPGAARIGRAAGCLAGGLLLLGLAARLGPAGEGAAVASQGALEEVVVARLALPSGAAVSMSDLALLRVPASPVTARVLQDPGAAVGRRLRVAIAAGAPLEASMLEPPSAAVGGGRVVRLVLPADRVPDGLAPGSAVEVIAAGDASDGVRGGGRVSVVAVAEVVAVEPASGGGLAPAAGPGGPVSGGVDPATGPAGSLPVVAVTLSCGAEAALTVIWAERFARSVELVAHPAGAAVPPPVGGMP